MPLVKIKLVLEGQVELVSLTLDGKSVSEGVTRTRNVADPFEVCIKVGGLENIPWKLRVFVSDTERTSMKGTITATGFDSKCKRYYVL